MPFEKNLLLVHKNQNVEATIRNYHQDDFDQLIAIQKACFPPPFPSDLWWNEQQLENHVSIFQEGALCVEIEEELVGSMTGMLVSFDPTSLDHQWEEITDNGYIRTHDPAGNTLYVVDISVKPSYRGLDLGKWLMQSMYELVVHHELDRLLGGGRMPGYHRVANQLTAEEYVEEVVKGKRKDPVLTFLLRCGRTPLGVVEQYLEDEESHHYAALMEWRNPFKRGH